MGWRVLRVGEFDGVCARGRFLGGGRHGGCVLRKYWRAERLEYCTAYGFRFLDVDPDRGMGRFGEEE